jgi:hypothetical protein
MIINNYFIAYLLVYNEGPPKIKPAAVLIFF